MGRIVLVGRLLFMVSSPVMTFIEQVARVAHETNRACCQIIGDDSQRSWDQAEQWQRDSAMKGVEFRLQNPGAPESAQHDAWTADKVADGWKFGPVKDAAKKEHPCLVPYLELPVEQRLKDYLFVAVVDAFLRAGMLESVRRA
jgi:hypothetical protein